jgi:hypothetical protein
MGPKAIRLFEGMGIEVSDGPGTDMAGADEGDQHAMEQEFQDEVAMDAGCEMDMHDEMHEHADGGELSCPMDEDEEHMD